MERSEAIDQLVTALVAAQSEFPPLEKDKTATVPMKSGGAYTYSYIDLDTILKAVMPVLNKNGLALWQGVERGAEGVVAIETVLAHVSGQWVANTTFMPYAGDTAQAFGSAVTYARRYAAAPMLGLSFEEDDDAHQAQPHAAPAADWSGDAAEYVWPFGKHKGTKVKDLERGFLQWAKDKMEDGPARRQAIAFLDASVGHQEVEYLVDQAEVSAAAGNDVNVEKVKAGIQQKRDSMGYIPRAWWVAALEAIGSSPAGFDPNNYQTEVKEY